MRARSTGDRARRIRRRLQENVKRIFDLFFSCLGLVLFFPAGLLIAGMVKLTSPGPVFFLHERPGYKR